MCYVPHVAIFYSISKRERYQWCLYVMLCREQVLYCSCDCFFTVFQQTLSHPCIFRFCWLLVHCIMMLTGCMIYRICNYPSVCFK